MFNINQSGFKRGLLFTCAAAVLLAFTSTSSGVNNTPSGSIRVLIVEGFNNHDWRQTTNAIRSILGDTGLFSIDVSTAPSSPDAPEWRTWKPKFSAYDVVIQNTNNIGKKQLRWPRQVERALQEYVKSGGGLYIFHSANNAFDHWKEYDRMIGLAWRSKDAGVALEIKDGKVHRVAPGRGKGTSHGPRRDTVVRILEDHPINRGYPKSWKTPSLEVYTYARGPAENLTVLSYAYDEPTGKNWPIEWLVAYGQGRVYNSTFGHFWPGEVQPAGIRCVGFQTTLVRAVQWLADREVTWPVPSGFPTQNSISLRNRIPESKLYTFTVKNIDGRPVSFSEYEGKVLLIVNVASKCGFTRQYSGLQKLYEKYKDRGFYVLGFPANDFGSQEPGTNSQIKEFCTTRFNVAFPMFSKITVRGESIHPLYAYLIDPQENEGFGGPITWNFNKFLIGKDGETIARYPSKTEPFDSELIDALEKAL
jgi:glutathione peroxidase-family protein/type 1 glutamine amidotransferase